MYLDIVEKFNNFSRLIYKLKLKSYTVQACTLDLLT